MRKYGRVAGVVHNSDYGQTAMTVDRLQMDRLPMHSEKLSLIGERTQVSDLGGWITFPLK